MPEAQAWKYECPCGDESETFQNRQTAETARRNHHIQCEETPEVVGVPYVADGGSHMVKACPECNSSNIRINTPGAIHGSEPGGRCYCCTCEQYFDEPHEREGQGRSNTPAAGEETLKAMDPDELLTDGGRSKLQLGDRLLDEDNDDDDAFVRVVTPRPNTRVDQFVVYETDDGTEQTVYDYHRGEVPASDSVVDVVYEESLEAALGDLGRMPQDDILDFLQTYAIDSFVANGSKVTVYSFPRSRLSRVAEPCEECEAGAAEFMSGGGDEAGGDGGDRR